MGGQGNRDAISALITSDLAHTRELKCENGATRSVTAYRLCGDVSTYPFEALAFVGVSRNIDRCTTVFTGLSAQIPP